MNDERQAQEGNDREDEGQAQGTGAVPPEKAVPPAFEPGRKQPRRDGEASDDLQNDPAYEPDDQGLKGIKGG
jgi:hypothetical protein